MTNVTGLEWKNGTSHGAENTPLSAENLNKLNKDTAQAINGLILEIEEALEHKNYIKKYNNNNAVLSSVECNDNEVRVGGKDLKVENNIQLNQGKSVFTDYLASKNNQDGVVNGTVSNALSADSATNASVANKLATSSAGSTNQPVYFNNGVPTAITSYTVRKETFNTLGDFYTALKNATTFTPDKIIFVDMDITLSRNYTTKGNIFFGTAAQSTGSVVPVSWEYMTDMSGYLLHLLKYRFIFVDNTSSDFTFKQLSNIDVEDTHSLRLYSNNIVYRENCYSTNLNPGHGSNPYCCLGDTSVSIQDERNTAGTITVVYYDND